MAYVDRYQIPEDQYDDGRILGTLKAHQVRAHLKAMLDQRLADLFQDFWTAKGRFNYDQPVFLEIREECQFGNLTTLMLMVAQEAYERDILDEGDFIRLQDEG